MRPLAKLEILGPATLFAGIFASEGAVYALNRWPTSDVFWYLNLRLFDVFQPSHYLLSDYVQIEYFQLFYIALPLFALALGGLFLRRQLPLAIASSLSFMYVSFVMYAWCVGGMGGLRILLGGSSQPRPDLCLDIVLLISSTLSCIVSHVGYITTIFAEANGK